MTVFHLIAHKHTIHYGSVKHVLREDTDTILPYRVTFTLHCVSKASYKCLRGNLLHTALYNDFPLQCLCCNIFIYMHAYTYI